MCGPLGHVYKHPIMQYVAIHNSRLGIIVVPEPF